MVANCLPSLSSLLFIDYLLLYFDSCCAVVKCPAPEKYRCTTSLQPVCEDTDSCPDGKICCFDGCRRRCLDFKSSPLAGLYLFYATVCQTEAPFDIFRTK